MKIERLGEVLESLNFDKNFNQRQEHIKNILARYLNLKTVVALIGSGASIPIGYPSWTGFAKDTLTRAKKLCPKKKEILNKYLKYLREEQGKELSAQVMLGECERLCGDLKNGQSKKFREQVEKYFEKQHDRFPDKNASSPNNQPDKNNNPYIALLELPIRRFITTNYDLEIERALLLKRRIPHSLSNEKICSAKKGTIIDLTAGKSFSQKKGDCDSLAKFPIARYEDNEHMVFHCHGRIDDIFSCVITEEDYQKWYLRDDPDALPFRQAFDLTLGSNPILIIGYGLADIDLMRWLRAIAANRPNDKIRNPLFCINYITSEDYKNKWHSQPRLIEDETDALYQRYGLHVINIYEKHPETAEKITLCDALLDLKTCWQAWWEGLLLKPKFREIPQGNFLESSYYHYKIHIDKNKSIRSLHEELKGQLDQKLNLTKEGDSGHGLAIVVGDGGTGKSWSVQKYLEEKEQEFNHPSSQRNKKFNHPLSKEEKWTFVFWSSYYANDVLTGIDRLNEYFDCLFGKTDKDAGSPIAIAEDRFEKLANHLKEQGKMVIVFDGTEKLLNPTKEKNIGESISPEITKFFKLISNHHNNIKCKVIITTRLFPRDVLLDSDDNQDSKETSLKIENSLRPVSQTSPEAEEAPSGEQEKPKKRKDLEIIAPRCWSKNLLDIKKGIDEFSFLSFSDDEQKKEKGGNLSSLCSLVDGHIFCIALIRGILEDFPQANITAVNKFGELIRDIANTPIDRRIYRVIQEAIEHLDKNRNKNKFVEKFVERISLFMNPVRKEVTKVCFREVEQEIKNMRSDKEGNVFNSMKFNNLLQDLVNKNLLQEVSLDGREKIVGYVVHPLIRNYIHQTIHKSLFTSLPSLQLPGHTSAMEVVDPGSKERGVPVTQSLFKKLCDDAREPFENVEEDQSERKLVPIYEKKVCLDLCRGAFSILRSRFCTNTVTRWGDYREYIRMVVDLYDTARTVSEQEVWRHNEPTPQGKEFSESRLTPLYADEMAWVYNEIGLASFSMGNLLNAIPFREQGIEISRLIDSDQNGRYSFQSEFNLGTAYIFLGRLNFALKYLERAIEIGSKLNDDKLTSRVKAYIALVKYLQGSLEEADIEFEKAYEGLGDNSRARGVFYCYHGELLLKLNKLGPAKEKIAQSRHIGEAEYYPDLVAYARLANANYLVKQKNYNEAQNEYLFALREAKEKKIRRLETGVLSGMSRLAYELNDSEVAKQRAVESLKIANEYAICLHQPVGLLVLGKALVKEGNQRDLGIACLKTARDIAKSQGYFLRKNEAEDELQKLKAM